MIDWHSHILPVMDDGSKSHEESSCLLQMLYDQGAEKVVATPHFYANDESVVGFMERRQKSYEGLVDSLTVQSPDVILGAEVRYYPGIGKLAELERLCIENSNLLLLEMPMEKWTSYTIKELTDIINTRNVRLLLAHIERYLSMQSRGSLDALLEAGILMQANASFFTEFKTKRKALSLLQNGYIHTVGSDCHNLKHRPPRLHKAYAVIRKKLGDTFVTQFDEYGNSLLTNH